MADIDELIGKLARDNAAVKRAPHPFLLSIEWIVVAAFYLAVSLMMSGMRHDLWPKLHEPWFVAEIAALSGIFIIHLLERRAAVLSRSAPEAPASHWRPSRRLRCSCW